MPPAQVERHRMSAIRILHVDDEPDIREIVDISLGLNPDFDVRACASGADAIATAADWKPFLILLDVVMPERNGFQVCRTLKNSQAYKSIPIILVSGKSTTSDRYWAEQPGANGYIAKPFASVDLLREVRRFA